MIAHYLIIDAQSDRKKHAAGSCEQFALWVCESTSGLIHWLRTGRSAGAGPGPRPGVGPYWRVLLPRRPVRA
ncbi:hypothetical protein SANT12839_068940 [Streptomyces antimycoticus]|uniref:Uncharacterized protein n=1 Tax=Streptomyces antimycoticus TaxID=68175 RepID=A0A4D4KCJ0_9ACTN|nr:hypothetical protein SANT12839_068940 [Streptomyces antimycoticus]